MLGEERFAALTANHSPMRKKPLLQEAPMVLSGRGRVKLDTSYFTEAEFKSFANKHGIKLDQENNSTKELVADLTRPPKVFFHKGGREPVEHDPRTM